MELYNDQLSIFDEKKSHERVLKRKLFKVS